jgi:hypothetical protein
MVNGRPATAGEMGNPNQNIPGWPVVKDKTVRNGDIVAIAHSGPGYSGHTGIIAIFNGKPYTVSADSNKREITWGQFGFRTGDDANRVIRRCECEN